MARPLTAFLIFCFAGAAFSDEPKPVVVAAYNVLNYLIMERRVDGVSVPEAPKPESEIEAVLQVITASSPDVLGLAEIGEESMLADLQKRLQAVGLNYPHSEWVKGADEHRHLGLLSKFPIISRDSRDDVPFELDGKRQRISRGILDVTVQVNPEYKLRLVGAHLKSRREVPEFDQAQFRAKEAWHLKQHINQILEASPETNLLLFGDLNDSKNEYAVKELIGTRGTPNYLMDLWLKDSRNERWTYYWKTADTYSRIDYLMVSPAMVKEVDLEKSGINDLPVWNDASDHRLIYTVINPVDL
ncbi:MAG: endonuclease/exonuclease/phosphatase family protein [Terrimicrobiaceae bacterium]